MSRVADLQFLHCMLFYILRTSKPEEIYDYSFFCILQKGIRIYFTSLVKFISYRFQKIFFGRFLLLRPLKESTVSVSFFTFDGFYYTISFFAEVKEHEADHVRNLFLIRLKVVDLIIITTAILTIMLKLPIMNRPIATNC